MSYELALDVVDRVRQLWKVDNELMCWMGDVSPRAMLTEGYGFDWWPGDFKVSLRVHGPHRVDAGDDVPTYRMSVRTEVLEGVDVTASSALVQLAEANAGRPGLALALAPPEIVAMDAEIDRHLPVHMSTVAYVNAGTWGWLADVFAGVAVLQPGEVQRIAADLAGRMGGRIAHALPPGQAGNTPHDEMLMVDELYLLDGAAPDLELAAREFPEIMSRWGSTEWTYGHAEEGRACLEMSFGDQSALLWLHRDLALERLGYGLTANLMLPYRASAQETAQLANFLNYSEAGGWTDGYPALLGTWLAQVEEDGLYRLCHRSFVPRLLDRDGIGAAVTDWMLSRAQWAKRTCWPDLRNRPLAETLSHRRRLTE